MELMGVQMCYGHSQDTENKMRGGQWLRQLT